MCVKFAKIVEIIILGAFVVNILALSFRRSDLHSKDKALRSVKKEIKNEIKQNCMKERRKESRRRVKEKKKRERD